MFGELRIQSGNITVRLAKSKEEIEQAQKLRYEMLVLDFDETKDVNGSDASEYDEFCDHLIAIDEETKKVVGTYRLMSNFHLVHKDKFICEEEFDVTRLKDCGDNILELGRAVVDKNYRNGVVIKLLWQALFTYCKLKNIRYMFGTGSFHGLNKNDYLNAFSWLYYEHKIDDKHDCFAKEPCSKMDLLPREEVDARLAKQEMPALIKGYVALGSKVGSGVYFDHDFNSTDVMLIFDLENVNKAYAKRMFGVEL